MAIECPYCGSDVADHDPVRVSRRRGGEFVEAVTFCNYTCLSAHIHEEQLATGACCRIDP